MARGFTIAEIIVVVGIIGVMAAVGVGSYSSLRPVRQYQQAAAIYVDVLRQAQVAARTMEADTAWGVRAASGELVLFAGSSYASRTPALDETYAIESSVTIGGSTEVVFAKFTGLPAATATTTFSNTYGSQAVVISTTGSIYEAN